MSTFEQRKTALPSETLPKSEVTRVTGVTGYQAINSTPENLLRPPGYKGLHGVTTAERIFEKFALRYARKGFRVFPLAPGSKKPLKDSRGLSEATADIDVVARMAREHPFANIGLATGPESGICAIDIDPLAGGFETERKLRSEAKTWPIAPVQRTRSGGRHIILQYHPLIVTGSNRLGRGIDFRGAGGYAVAAPSIVGGKRYSWLCWPPSGPAPAPQWLLDNLAAEAAAKKRAEEGGRLKSNPVVLEPDLERARRALCFIPSDDRDTWLAVGMALAGLGECGRDLWDEWSRQSAKFNEADQVKAWRSFKRAGRSFGTIFWLRRRYRGRAPIYSL